MSELVWDPAVTMLRVGQHLTAIVRLYRDLEREAIHRYADKAYPGGDAMLMLGPVANLEAFNYRQLSELMGRTENGSGLDDLDTDPAPPLLVLAGWADVVSSERGDDRTQRATIEREAAYLRDTLAWTCGANSDDEPYFLACLEMVRDLGDLVRRLESILHDGIAIDHGVPCMRCGSGIEKVWGKDEDHDRWVCRRCNEWSSNDQYNQAVRADYLKNAHALTAAHMLEQYRIKPGSLTGWAAKGLVSKHGTNDQGRVLYDVAEAVAQRDRKAESEVA